LRYATAMTRLLSITIFGALAACTSDLSEPAGVHLPSDGHFIMIPQGYTSPWACLAAEPNPYICQESLSLCRNGRAGYRRGDLVSEGTYEMAGPIATITCVDGSPLMAFDVAAVTSVDDPVHWTVDTDHDYMELQFDNIGCE